MLESSAESIPLWGVFLIGLGMNLTPCVYPMLSVTVSLFEHEHEDTRIPTFFKALVYVLGIATMYSALGVVAATTGGLFGAILQNRWVLMSIGAILVLMSMSMFGFYTLQMPQWMLKRVGVRREATLTGLYLSGLFVGIFAAPCIGPPIVALLAVVGSQGDPTTAFWTFFILSLGLGTPYLILGTFSGLLRRLPQSGGWLVWVERLFGCALLTFGIFYLLLAFIPSWSQSLPPFAMIASGLYLGFLEKSAAYSEFFKKFKKAAGAIAITAGVLLISIAPKAQVEWEPYQPIRLEEAKAASQPVILDFYADWCIPCHELDRFTYSDPEVIASLETFVRMKVDVTRPDLPESTEVLARFAVPGVPAIVFLDPQGEEIEGARITGFVPAKEFLEIVNAADFQQKMT